MCMIGPRNGVKVIWVGYGYGMVVYIWVDKGRE